MDKHEIDLIEMAAALLDSEAASLSRSQSIGPDWHGDEGAKAAHDEMKSTSERLYALADKMKAALSSVDAQPVAWVRRHPDGALTAEFLEDAVIEPVRKKSGAWVPLYRSPLPQAAQQVNWKQHIHLQPVACADEPDAHNVIFKVGVQSFVIGCIPHDSKEGAEWFAAQVVKALENACTLAAHPAAQPAVLTDAQKDAIYTAWRDQGDDASYGDLIDATERAVLLRHTAAPGVPEGWRERLQEMQDASYTYSQYPELARVIFDSVIDALDELEPASPSPAPALSAVDAKEVNSDETALDVAREIMKVVNGSWLPGGATQVQAKIQCIVGDAIRALQSQPAGKDALTFADALKIANGCTDYGGGYRGNDEHFQIYQHGIQTVINALNGAAKAGLADTQVRALHGIGSAAIAQQENG